MKSSTSLEVGSVTGSSCANAIVIGTTLFERMFDHLASCLPTSMLSAYLGTEYAARIVRCGRYSGSTV